MASTMKPHAWPCGWVGRKAEWLVGWPCAVCLLFWSEARVSEPSVDEASNHQGGWVWSLNSGHCNLVWPTLT